MHHSRPWSPLTVLLGSRDADEIDDAMRDFAIDISERLADIVVDVAADPLKLKTPGNRTHFHWSAGHWSSLAAPPYQETESYIATTGTPPTANASGYFALPYPVGSTIKEVSALVAQIDAGGVVSIALNDIAPDGSTTFIGLASAVTDPAVQTITIGPISHLVEVGHSLMVIVNMVSSLGSLNQRFYNLSVLADTVWGS